jgi:hypothetical protein
MKKLSLEKLKLAADDVLQRDQLSTIYGGSGGGCYLTCPNWSRSMEVADCSLSTREFYCGVPDPEATCNCA